MSNIVNLNKARKAKQKQEDKRQAEQNRVIHGVSSKLRKREAARQAEASRTLDGHLLKSGEDMKKD